MSEAENRVYTHASDGEIDLVDIFLAVWTHRYIGLATFLIVAAAGVGASFFLPEKYGYSAVIEIGGVPAENETIPFETPSSLVAKIKNTYLPSAKREMQESVKDAKNEYSIDVVSPKDSLLVVLNAEAVKKDERQFLAVMEKVIQHVVEDHTHLLEDVTAELNVKLISSLNELEANKGKIQLLKSDLQRIDKNAELLREQISELRKSIASTEESRMKVMSSSSPETRALTLLLIDNQLEQAQERLSRLEEKLILELERRRDELTVAMGKAHRDAEYYEQRVNQAKASISSLRRTKAIAEPYGSLEPVSAGLMLRCIFSIVIAGFMAMLAIVFAIFGDAVSRRLT